MIGQNNLKILKIVFILLELTRGEYEMAYFIKEELIDKKFDGTIITC